MPDREDDDLVTRLRAYLEGYSTYPRPSRPQPRRWSQLRIVVGPLVGMAVAGVLIVAFALSHSSLESSSRPRSGPSAVQTPYLGKPTAQSPFPTATATPTAGAACSAGDLRVSSTFPGGYQGYATETVELVDASAIPCYLPGAPVMQLALESGAAESVSLGQWATHSVAFQPSQGVMLVFGSPSTCATIGSAQPASSLQLTFAAGGTITVSGLELDVQCGSPTLLVFAPTSALPASS